MQKHCFLRLSFLTFIIIIIINIIYTQVASYCKIKLLILKLVHVGAQAKNGCLFVTLPEHAKFGTLSDRDAERIFKYLVGLARYQFCLNNRLYS